MKKYILSTIVALGVTTSAIAEVNIYGRINESIRYTKPDNGESSTKLLSSSYMNSMIGFKGEENIGNGISVSFILEGNIDPTTGTAGQNNKFFDRESSVTLNTNIGSLTLGKADTSSAEGIEGFVGFNNFGNFALLPPGTESIGQDRDNTVRYSSPSLGGFSLQVGRSLASDNLGDTDSVSLSFNNSAFGTMIGYEKMGDKTFKAVGGRASFSIIDLGVMVGQREDVLNTDTMVVTSKVSLVDSIAAHGLYKMIDTESRDKMTITAFGLSKSFSKRTSILGVVQNVDKGTIAGTFYEVNILHLF
jgi:predicted porin